MQLAPKCRSIDRRSSMPVLNCVLGGTCANLRCDACAGRQAKGGASAEVGTVKLPLLVFLAISATGSKSSSCADCSGPSSLQHTLGHYATSKHS